LAFNPPDSDLPSFLVHAAVISIPRKKKGGFLPPLSQCIFFSVFARLARLASKGLLLCAAFSSFLAGIFSPSGT